MLGLEAIVTILGSGTSAGVPVVGCPCAVCNSQNSFNQRLRSSIWIRVLEPEFNLLIDTSPDLRAQALSNGMNNLDAVLYTHVHADHCHGFDDLRAFYFFKKKSIPCWLDLQHQQELRRRFSYAFEDTGYKGTPPQVTLETIPENDFQIGPLLIEPLRLKHGAGYSVGFKIGQFSYVTDYEELPEKGFQKWGGKIDTMISSGLRHQPHPSHITIKDACAVLDRLKVRDGVLTHLAHEVDYDVENNNLPKNRRLAYDGLSFKVLL